ncbi:hypothetical protein D9611_013023 [Ephemerocybe angulata]|uniref:CBM1 domain-containing protein n=1 Tax=Ephemerocybe angulata TaxID=980116 RepID=A0A8H5ESW0_9AGAR|nr:hypothetical protein D9611_013023 [Tulosesus angulatus]
MSPSSRLVFQIFAVFSAITMVAGATLTVAPTPVATATPEIETCPAPSEAPKCCPEFTTTTATFGQQCTSLMCKSETTYWSRTVAPTQGDAALTAAASSTTYSTYPNCRAGLYQQCGGVGFMGATECEG